MADMDITDPKVSKRFFEKLKNEPAIPLGVLAFFAVGFYGIRNYKNQKYKDPTAYFGALRVYAQGMVLGALMIPFFQHMYKSYTTPSPAKKEQ